MKLLLTLATVTALLAGPTEAAQSVTVSGLAAASCGAWTASRHDQSAKGHEQWLLGYLSGTADNARGKIDPLRQLDFYAVTAWIDSYCETHPLNDLLKAGRSFVLAHPR